MQPIHTLFRWLALALALAATLVAPAAVLAEPTPLDLSTYISREFPDRKTSSYDSQKLTSYLAGHLQANGWQAEVQPYSTLVRAGEEAPAETVFMQVSGENVLAFATTPSAQSAIDLLLLAPYDVLFKESADAGSLPSYTARATAALLDFAVRNSPADLPVNVVVAFVSGHYQYGAGVESLLAKLRGDGVTVRAAAVVGDIDALRSLPLAVTGATPVPLASAAYRAARGSGLDVTVVGPRVRDTWMHTAGGPGDTNTAEFVLDGGEFLGEAESLQASGIPALTLGLPRGNPSPVMTAGYPSKSAGVASSLKTLASLIEPIAAGLASAPAVRDTVIVQAFGMAPFVTRSVVLAACVAVAAAAVAAIWLALKSQRDLGPLALMCGVLGAFLAAHGLRAIWYSIGGARYGLLAHPARLMPVYMASAIGLVLLGFLRLWRIRTRIAHLHSRVPGAAPAAPASPTHNWAGPWGLAFSAAVLLGTGILGSELAPAAALATLSLTVAVLLDREKSAPAWLKRFLCTVPLLPLIFWAGFPLGGDASSIYALTLTRPGIENSSFTILCAALVACFLSTFTFPAPAQPERLRIMTLAELGAVALIVATGALVPSLGAARLPAVAVVQEYLGSEARMTIDTPRALGTVSLAGPRGQTSTIVPPSITNRSLSDNIRLSTTPEASPWADARQTVASTVKDSTTRVSALAVGTLQEQPSLYQLRFQSTGFSKTASAPFTLENLAQILGTDATVRLPDLGAWTGYSVSIVRWMPRDKVLSAPFVISYNPSSTSVDVSCRAVFLDRSGLGMSPSADGARFLMVTNITRQESYR